MEGTVNNWEELVEANGMRIGRNWGINVKKLGREWQGAWRNLYKKIERIL